MDVSPGQTEVKQGNFVEFISRVKGYFRETYKLQNINPLSPTPKFTLGRGVSVSKIFTMLLHSLFPLIWYAIWPCSEKKLKVWSFDPYPRVLGEGRSACKIFATMLLHFLIPFNLICNMTMFWKVEFWPIDPIPRVEEDGGLRAKYLLPCCCICDSLEFDMCHDHILKN